MSARIWDDFLNYLLVLAFSTHPCICVKGTHEREPNKVTVAGGPQTIG